MKHNIQFYLHTDTPDIVILHTGCNDISPRRNQEKMTEEEIVKNIIETAQQCKFQGVRNIIISGLTCRIGHNSNVRIGKVNDPLVKRCHEYNFGFIDKARTSLYRWDAFAR